MVMGIGRGDSSRRVLGKKPTTLENLEDFVKTFRELNAGRSIDHEGVSTKFPWANAGVTPVWVAGIVGLFPMLNILRLVGLLYSLFLLYLGLPVLMRVPQEKAMRYSVVVMISAVVLFFVIGFIVALLGGGPVIETAGPFPSA